MTIIAQTKMEFSETIKCGAIMLVERDDDGEENNTHNVAGLVIELRDNKLGGFLAFMPVDETGKFGYERSGFNIPASEIPALIYELQRLLVVK